MDGQRLGEPAGGWGSPSRPHWSWHSWRPPPSSTCHPAQHFAPTSGPTASCPSLVEVGARDGGRRGGGALTGRSLEAVIRRDEAGRGEGPREGDRGPEKKRAPALGSWALEGSAGAAVGAEEEAGQADQAQGVRTPRKGVRGFGAGRWIAAKRRRTSGGGSGGRNGGGGVLGKWREKWGVLGLAAPRGDGTEGEMGTLPAHSAWAAAPTRSVPGPPGPCLRVHPPRGGL